MRKTVLAVALCLALLPGTALGHSQPYCGHGSYASGYDLVVFRVAGPGPFFFHTHYSDHFRWVPYGNGWAYQHSEATVCVTH